VVARKHRRPILRQALAVPHRQAERDQDHRAHDHGEEQIAQQPDEGVRAHG
jgi:hypothetical protein